VTSLAEPIAEPAASGRLARLVAKLSGQGGDRSRAGAAALNAFAIRVASAGIAYLTQVILARWMGTFDYGIFVWVWVWVLILGGLSSMGLNISMMRLVPEYLERGNFPMLRGLLRDTRLLTVTVSTTVAATGMTLLWLFRAQVETPYLWPLLLGLCCLPPYTLTDMHDGIGRSRSWINTALLPPYVVRPLLILFGMVNAHALGLPMTATTAIGAAILASWLTCVMQALAIRRKLSEVVPPGPRAREPKAWVATALPIFAISACELVLQNVDVLVLAHYLSADAVGVYFAALKTISLITFVGYAVGSAVSGRLSTQHVRGDRAGLTATVNDAVNWTFWPTLFGAAVLLALGKPLLSLFGPDFAAGYPAMAVLVVGLLVRAAVGPAEFMLRMLGAQIACAAVVGGSALLSLALNLALVPVWGIFGAAAATSTALIASAVAFAVVARWKLGLDMTIVSATRALFIKRAS
jgi:O-antigen/teichoic acid export membrane protein